MPSPIEISIPLNTEYRLDHLKNFYEKKSLSDIEEKPVKQAEKRHSNTSPSIVSHFLTIQVRRLVLSLLIIPSLQRQESSNMNFQMSSFS